MGCYPISGNCGSPIRLRVLGHRRGLMVQQITASGAQLAGVFDAAGAVFLCTKPKGLRNDRRRS